MKVEQPNNTPAFKVDTENKKPNPAQIDDLLSGIGEIRLKEVVKGRKELGRGQIKITELCGEFDEGVTNNCVGNIEDSFKKNPTAEQKIINFKKDFV